MITAVAKPFLPLGCFLMYLSVFMRMSHPAPLVKHHSAAAPEPVSATTFRPMPAPHPATRHLLPQDNLAWPFGQLGYMLALPVVPVPLSRPQ